MKFPAVCLWNTGSATRTVPLDATTASPKWLLKQRGVGWSTSFGTLMVLQSPSGGSRNTMPLDKEGLAWAAGLFEGEGCFHFASRANRVIVASLTTTDEDVVRRFHAIV